MRHAEARERISDIALEPGRLAHLGDDPSPETGALREHLAACRSCSGDLDAWRRTWALAGAALSSSDGVRDGRGAAGDNTIAGASGMLRAPASLRAKTLARIAAEDGDREAVRETARPVIARRGIPGIFDGVRTRVSDMPRPPVPALADSRRGMSRRQWVPRLAIAAALVIALGAGSLGWTRTRDLDRAQAENASLTAAMASLDRVLTAPAHWTAILRTADGAAGGSVAWSDTEVAVITTALSKPIGGQLYNCWIERGGVRTPIGAMRFSGHTGYWAGPVDGWGALLSPGVRLGVSLGAGGDTPVVPVLAGTL